MRILLFLAHGMMLELFYCRHQMLNRYRTKVVLDRIQEERTLVQLLLLLTDLDINIQSIH